MSPHCRWYDRSAGSCWGSPMRRVAYIVACGLTACACSGSAPNWSLFSTPAPPPPPAALRVESDPPGAEAKSSLGLSCRTPCELRVADTRQDFLVTMTLEGYLPQTLPV